LGWKPQVRQIIKVFSFSDFEFLNFFVFLEFHYFGLQKVPIIPSDGGISRVREVYLGLNLPFLFLYLSKSRCYVGWQIELINLLVLFLLHLIMI
jgi:hypothetical protein